MRMRVMRVIIISVMFFCCCAVLFVSSFSISCKKVRYY